MVSADGKPPHFVLQVASKVDIRLLIFEQRTEFVICFSATVSFRRRRISVTVLVRRLHRFPPHWLQSQASSRKPNMRYEAVLGLSVASGAGLRRVPCRDAFSCTAPALTYQVRDLWAANTSITRDRMNAVRHRKGRQRNIRAWPAVVSSNPCSCSSRRVKRHVRITTVNPASWQDPPRSCSAQEMSASLSCRDDFGQFIVNES